ncbi:MAG: aldolase/citrate lyase family protein [Spirochaetia bacterium]|jgi:2-keto-3-deoxy-L-rhamnonate aldolase RhmA|nr:aldolase/citrate lyase family protein [Spirochaetia bacterium]
MIKENLLRKALDTHKPTVATRIWSTWPTVVEACAASGNFDYVEFVAEYSPFDQHDLENWVRACELGGIASMIKVDFQNRNYVAQRALACGFQSIMFTDHKTAEEVEATLHAISPDSKQYGGRFGYPNARWIGYQPHLSQTEYAKMVHSAVKSFMIEKKEAMDNIEEICSIKGVDMVQFGPSDYSMSLGWDAKDHKEDIRKVEEKMIRTALDHGVAPRCECDSIEKMQYYMDLGVRNFCIGDQFRILDAYWKGTCGKAKDLAATLK